METTEVFIGRLSEKTSKTGLRRYFEAYGRVIVAAIIKDPIAGKPTGYGFVSFAEPRVVDQVLRLRHELDGITIKVEASLPLEPSNNASANKIYVGNLDQRVELFHLMKYFIQFGMISDVLMSTGSKGKRQRYAFVTFESTDAVRRALKPREHRLGEDMQPVIVNRAYSEALKVHKFIPMLPWRHKGVNPQESSEIGHAQNVGCGGQQQSSTENFWDESYRHQQKSLSNRQISSRAWAHNLTRYFQHGQVGEDTEVADMKPLQDKTTSGSKMFREREKNYTSIQDGEDKKSLQKFGRMPKCIGSSKDVQYRQPFNLHEIIPQNLGQKFKQMEIGESSRSYAQSSRSGESQLKSEDRQKTHSAEGSSRGKQVHQGDRTFKPPGRVSFQEESCKLNNEDRVDRGESSRESSKGKETKKKSKNIQSFRGIAAKTRVVRFRDSDSESQNDAEKGKKPNYGSYYDTSSFRDENVGSKGGITKLVLKDDSTTSSSSTGSSGHR